MNTNQSLHSAEKLPCKDTIDLIDANGICHITLWSRSVKNESRLTNENPIRIAKDKVIDVFVDEKEIGSSQISTVLAMVNLKLGENYDYIEEA